MNAYTMNRVGLLVAVVATLFCSHVVQMQPTTNSTTGAPTTIALSKCANGFRRCNPTFQYCDADDNGGFACKFKCTQRHGFCTLDNKCSCPKDLNKSMILTQASKECYQCHLRDKKPDGQVCLRSHDCAGDVCKLSGDPVERKQFVRRCCNVDGQSDSCLACGKQGECADCRDSHNFTVHQNKSYHPCVSKTAHGQKCDADTDCASRHCRGGVCCNDKGSHDECGKCLAEADAVKLGADSSPGDCRACKDDVSHNLTAGNCAPIVVLQKEGKNCTCNGDYRNVDHPETGHNQYYGGANCKTLVEGRGMCYVQEKADCTYTHKNKAGFWSFQPCNECPRVTNKCILSKDCSCPEGTHVKITATAQTTGQTCYQCAPYKSCQKPDGTSYKQTGPTNSPCPCQKTKTTNWILRKGLGADNLACIVQPICTSLAGRCTIDAECQCNGISAQFPKGFRKVATTVQGGTRKCFQCEDASKKLDGEQCTTNAECGGKSCKTAYTKVAAGSFKIATGKVCCNSAGQTSKCDGCVAGAGTADSGGCGQCTLNHDIDPANQFCAPKILTTSTILTTTSTRTTQSTASTSTTTTTTTTSTVTTTTTTATTTTATTTTSSSTSSSSSTITETTTTTTVTSTTIASTTTTTTTTTTIETTVATTIETTVAMDASTTTTTTTTSGTGTGAGGATTPEAVDTDSGTSTEAATGDDDGVVDTGDGTVYTDDAIVSLQEEADKAAKALTKAKNKLAELPEDATPEETAKAKAAVAKAKTTKKKKAAAVDKAIKAQASASDANEGGDTSDKSDKSDDSTTIIIVVIVAVLVVCGVSIGAFVALRNAGGAAPLSTAPQATAAFENPLYDAEPSAMQAVNEGTYAEIDQPAAGGGSSGYMDVRPNGATKDTSGYMDVRPNGATKDTSGYMDVAPDNNAQEFESDGEDV